MSTPATPEQDAAFWEEIMRSPLDPDPDENRPSYLWLPAIIAAAVVGLLLGLALGGPNQATPAASDGEESTTTTSDPPPPPDPILPPGYAGSDEVGLRPLASYTDGGSLYLIVSSATRSDLDRTEIGELHIADWTMAGDGVENVASRAIQSNLAPGVRLVEFPGVAALPLSDPELLVREATEMTVRTSCNGCAATSVDRAEGEVVLEDAVLPYSSLEPLVIEVGSGIQLSIDEVIATDEWGFATWHLVDDTEARTRVSLVIAFEGTDDPASEEVDPTLLVPARLMGPTPQNAIAGEPGAFTRNGSEQLDRVGEILSDENRPEQIVLRWVVEWQRPVGDPVLLSLEDTADLGSTE